MKWNLGSFQEGIFSLKFYARLSLRLTIKKIAVFLLRACESCRLCSPLYRLNILPLLSSPLSLSRYLSRHWQSKGNTVWFCWRWFLFKKQAKTHYLIFLSSILLWRLACFTLSIENQVSVMLFQWFIVIQKLLLLFSFYMLSFKFTRSWWFWGAWLFKHFSFISSCCQCYQSGFKLYFYLMLLWRLISNLISTSDD